MRGRDQLRTCCISSESFIHEPVFELTAFRKGRVRVNGLNRKTALSSVELTAGATPSWLCLEEGSWFYPGNQDLYRLLPL